MTLNELKNDVARLGFESHIEDEGAFIASVNRALSLIYVDRPVSRSTVISVRGPRATLVRDFIEHRSGETVSLEVSGRAVSFRTSGMGICVIRDRSGTSEIALTEDRQSVKRLLSGDATVTFSGDYYFTVTNLAVFDDLTGGDTSDIPEYTPFREIRPEEYCDDFRAFSSLPCDRDGNVAEAVRLVDGRITVPYNYRTELYLTYYRAARPVDKDQPDRAIDISEECAPMLPILTAAFMWLDDDAAKAQYYMSLYRDIVANVKRYSTNKIDTGYRVNGWA